MTTINKSINEDLEEIYLERERYLLNLDDLLEQILSENVGDTDMNLNIDKSFSNQDNISIREDINIDMDIPLTITCEFGKI